MKFFVSAVFFVLICMASATPVSAAQYFFNSPSGWTINTDSAYNGNVTPQTQTIAAPNVVGPVSEVSLRLSGVNHTNSADLDIMIVSPNGKKSVVMSDLGGTSDYNNANLNFGSDFGFAAPTGNTPLQSGYYYTPKDNEPAVGEFGPIAGGNSSVLLTADFAQFIGDSGAGNWKVSVVDDSFGNGGSIASATLFVDTDTVVPFKPSSVKEGNPDVDEVTTSTALSMSWNAASDAAGADQSGLKHYQWCLTTGYSTCENAALAGTTTNLFATFGSAVPSGRRYYSCVRSIDNVGNVSAYQCSDGVYITAPDTSNQASVTTTSPLTIDEGNANSATLPLTVSGATGAVSSIELYLNGTTHTYPSDLDILLESPTGVRSVVTSDAGGGTDINAENLVFKTGGAAVAEPLTSGTYAPADNAPANNEFQIVGIPGQLTADFSAFAGTTANGLWRIYIIDDSVGDGGSIGSVRLVVNTVPPAVVVPPENTPQTPSNETPPATSPPADVPPTTIVDVCPNIVGAQAQLPADKRLVDGTCVNVNAITGFSLSSKSIVVGQKKKLPSAKITIDRSALVAFTASKQVSGYVLKKSCVVKKPKNKPGVALKRCKLFVSTKAKAVVNVNASAATVILPVKFWKSLKAGKYIIAAQTSDGAVTSALFQNVVVKSAKKTR